MRGKGVPDLERGVPVVCVPSSPRVHRSSLFPPALSPSQPYLETVSRDRKGGGPRSTERPGLISFRVPLWNFISYGEEIGARARPLL